ncbi:hypothetical protein EVAR_31484_1 [Eumeta japonica]|uniref:Uncharacterized protein n=1 Tax=Eumeta variegata TaxID=151549 RepID=A0A4C1WCQ7_EUMVA|nr:hypothetical protein EVAR_31484_1 [Eumeta japonica]
MKWPQNVKSSRVLCFSTSLPLPSNGTGVAAPPAQGGRLGGAPQPVRRGLCPPPPATRPPRFGARATRRSIIKRVTTKKDRRSIFKIQTRNRNRFRTRSAPNPKSETPARAAFGRAASCGTFISIEPSEKLLRSTSGVRCYSTLPPSSPPARRGGRGRTSAQAQRSKGYDRCWRNEDISLSNKVFDTSISSHTPTKVLFEIEEPGFVTHVCRFGLETISTSSGKYGWSYSSSTSSHPSVNDVHQFQCTKKKYITFCTIGSKATRRVNNEAEWPRAPTIGLKLHNSLHFYRTSSMPFKVSVSDTSLKSHCSRRVSSRRLRYRP